MSKKDSSQQQSGQDTQKDVPKELINQGTFVFLIIVIIIVVVAGIAVVIIIIVTCKKSGESGKDE